MKKFSLLLVVILLIGALGFAPTSVFAQKFPSYTSGFQVQNLASALATISIDYYQADNGAAGAGTIVLNVGDTIAANASKTYFPTMSGSFTGSVVLSSDQPLAAVTNVQNSAKTAGAAYVAKSVGSNSVALPLLMKNNGSVPYDTWFSVQNTSTSTANIAIDYSDCPANTNTTVLPGASKTFYQASEACHTAKVFSGNITSDQPLVVVVMEENSAKMLAYTGFADGATDIVLPLINANNSGITTGVQIQNLGGSATNVTVSYTPSLAGAACTETQSIAANSSATFALKAFSTSQAGLTTTCAGGAKFVGSGKVTGNSTSQNLVAIVNQTKALYGEAYGAFDPASATGKLVMPLLMDRNGSNLYSTGFSIMNVGTTTAYVKCTLTNLPGGVSYSPSGTLAPGAALTPNQNGSIGVNYVGSGTCLTYTSATFATPDPNGKIVGIVNELGRTTADRLLVYEAVNVAP
jgi:hypothetical protein